MQGGKLLEDSVVKVDLPGKAKNSWRRDWFYYREETPAGEVAIPLYSSEPSRPRCLGVKKLREDLRAVVDLMLARLCELKKEGLKPINVYNCWMGHLLRSHEEAITSDVRLHGRVRLAPPLPRGVGGEGLRDNSRTHQKGAFQLAGRAAPAFRQGRQATTG